MHGRPSISGFLRSNENEARIQEVMQQEGVSIQVARNLLKGRSLGVGPGNKDKLGELQSPPPRGGLDTGSLPGPPPKMDKKAAERAMAMKLKKMQEEEEEKEDIEAKKKKAELLRKRSQGVIRLGPVSAREEQVDPLKIKVAAEQARREEEARRQEELRQMQERQQIAQQQQQASAGSSSEPRNKHAADAARRFVEEEPGRKKRKHREAEGDDSDEERGMKKGRALSPPPDERKAASSSGDGLMTEAQAMALVKKNKTSEIQRGTGKARERIQREMQEWEQSKAKNPEFWKPPKFCLVLGSGRR